MKFTQYTNFPKYVQDSYNTFCLLKFFPEEWQRDYFLDGKLYMRPHTDFPNSDLGEGRSDITEGAGIVVMPRNEKTFPEVKFVPDENGDICVQIVEHVKRPEDYKPTHFISYPNAQQKRNLFCMYALWMNTKTEELRLFDDTMIKNFGEYGIIITDMSAYINRIAVAGNSLPSIQEMHCGFVNYIPAAEEKNITEMNPYKKFANGFANQSEFRICAETDNKELLELDTGTSLHDIAIPINMKTFLKTVKLSNGSFSFEDDTGKL